MIVRNGDEINVTIYQAPTNGATTVTSPTKPNVKSKVVELEETTLNDVRTTNAKRI